MPWRAPILNPYTSVCNKFSFGFAEECVFHHKLIFQTKLYKFEKIFQLGITKKIKILPFDPKSTRSYASLVRKGCNQSCVKITKN